MGDTLTFEDRVVVITGAGNGLGRAYSHEFARRGAKVVVNDLGGSVDGEGSNKAAADAVVDEIRATNGQAVPNYDSVVDGEKIVQTALDEWGRVDVLINNAGIAYATPFHEMTIEAWDRMMDVHIKGSMVPTMAAWPHMIKAGFGRLIFTTSPFGLHSAPGFTHYSAAKAAMIGLGRALELEAMMGNLDIHANLLAPFSASRMTGFDNDQQADSEIGPHYLAQLAVLLCHDSHKEGGNIYETGGGIVFKARWQFSDGIDVRGDDCSAENMLRDWNKGVNFDNPSYPAIGDFQSVGRRLFGEEAAMTAFEDVAEQVLGDKTND